MSLKSETWMLDSDGELMKPSLKLYEELRLTDEQWDAWFEVFDAVTNSRQSGRGGVKFIRPAGDPEQARWVEVVEALINLGRISESDRAVALRSEWIKYSGCPGCDSSGAFARRDGGPKYDAGQVRVSCGRKCQTREVLGILGIDVQPDGADLTWIDEAANATRVEALPASNLPPASLDEVHEVFSRWFGDEYDTEALDVVLAAAAVEKLDGDPLWLLLISGSGNAKTETVVPLAGAGAQVVSSITSPGALLSATSKRERTKDATGGLLRQLGPRGLLVVKDVTSILSMSREMRGEVLAALREIYDGRWTRNVGTDGGRSLTWEGRLVVVGAVTTAWDQHHSVIASMGDRFVLVRMDSTKGRQAAGRRAIGNTGDETTMRAELAEVVGRLIVNVDPDTGIDLTDAETDRLLTAADVVTLARTGVETDSRGDVIDAHAPEMPTRFAKQLAQVVRGAVALGMDRGSAMRLAVRCARDSVPPLRLSIIDDVAAYPDSPLADIRRRLSKPRTTVDRQCQALDMLNVLTSTSEETEWRGRPATVWHYRLADGIDPKALDPNINTGEVSTHPQTPIEVGAPEATEHVPPSPPSDVSGTESTQVSDPLAAGWAMLEAHNAFVFARVEAES